MINAIIQDDAKKLCMEIIPITFRQASKYIALHHRHHYPPVGSKFCIAVSCSGTIVGVAVIGRPVSRRLDDGRTAEVTRLCTDGTKNVCSKLYGAAWRIAREMGYKRIITYILESESGTSLKASGWKSAGRAGGLRWSGIRKPKKDICPAQMKIRYEKISQKQ
jgi:hypothetical protein